MPENNNGVPNVVPQQTQPAPAPQPPQPVPVAPAPAPQPPQPASAPQPPQPAPAAPASVQPNTEVKPAPVQVPIQQLLEQQTVEQVQPEQPAQPTQPTQPTQPAQPVQQVPAAVNPHPVQQPLPTGPGVVYQQAPMQSYQTVSIDELARVNKRNNLILIAAIGIPLLLVVILFFFSGMAGNIDGKTGVDGKSARQIEAEINVFTNEAKAPLAIADNLYTEISMNHEDSRIYLKNSNSNTYKGMCVTLNGLVSNGYYNKDLKNGKIRGVILIEVPFDGGETKRSIWITNETYAITGYEKVMLDSLDFSEDNNEGLGNYYYSAPSKQGVVTDITKADSIINVANGKTLEKGASFIEDENGNRVDPSLAFTTNAKNVRLKEIHSPSNENGGTGEVYYGIVCINGRI